MSYPVDYAIDRHLYKSDELDKHLRELADEEWAVEQGHTCPPPPEHQKEVDNNERGI